MSLFIILLSLYIYLYSFFRLQRIMIYKELDFGLAIFWITQMPHKFNLCGLLYHNLWWTLRGLLLNLYGLLYHNLWFNLLFNLWGLSLNCWIYVVHYSILFVIQINKLCVLILYINIYSNKDIAEIIFILYSTIIIHICTISIVPLLIISKIT